MKAALKNSTSCLSFLAAILAWSTVARAEAPIDRYTCYRNKADTSGHPCVSTNPDDLLVKDNETGLMWRRQQSDEKTGHEVRTYCRVPQGGHSDWRLPSSLELSTLADDSRHSTAIGTAAGSSVDPIAFPNTPDTYSVTSTLDVSATVPGVWYVSTLNGATSTLAMDRNDWRIRCVRGTVKCLGDGGCNSSVPKCEPTTKTCVECLAKSDCGVGEFCNPETHSCEIGDCAGGDDCDDGAVCIASTNSCACDADEAWYRKEGKCQSLGVVSNGHDKGPDLGTWKGDYIIDDNGEVVVDLATGLVWQRGLCKCVGREDGKCNWSDAMACCDGLELAGKDDWRLPLLNELVSLYISGGDSIDLTAFLGTPAPAIDFYDFWSSSAYDQTQSWGIVFGMGGTTVSAPSNDAARVRCVR